MVFPENDGSDPSQSLLPPEVAEAMFHAGLEAFGPIPRPSDRQQADPSPRRDNKNIPKIIIVTPGVVLLGIFETDRSASVSFQEEHDHRVANGQKQRRLACPATRRLNDGKSHSECRNRYDGSCRALQVKEPTDSRVKMAFIPELAHAEEPSDSRSKGCVPPAVGLAVCILLFACWFVVGKIFVPDFGHDFEHRNLTCQQYKSCVYRAWRDSTPSVGLTSTSRVTGRETRRIAGGS